MKRITTARISQLLFLVIFLILFLRTEYRGDDLISAAVNGFFRADPLVAVATMLAEKRYSALVLPGIFVLCLSLLLGRFFCGWICPLGTMLDLVTKRITKTAPISCLKGSLKYWILVPLLTCSLFNLNLAGLLDPLAILVRALTFCLHPLIGETARSAWVGLFHFLGDGRDHLDPAYKLLRDYVLPFRESLYPLAFLSALVLAAIIILERFETRNWCRNLCPLGTMLGILSRYALFRRLPGRLCPDCGKCRDHCPTSFDQDMLRPEECIVCLNCELQCPAKRVRFRAGRPAVTQGPLMERRVLLGGLAGGIFLGKIFRFRDPVAQARMLRPPGVRNEEAFLGKCVRCGECMKVCLRSALYPALSQAGIAGLYTPVLIPRLGYCEYNCTLCGQVCPTGAVPALVPEDKTLEVIGKAVFDKNHCLPFNRHLDCIVCEEHCPVPGKAIRSEETQLVGAGGHKTVKVPYVVEELCNGCGICEFVCPLEGKSGIEIFAVKDRTPLAATREAGVSDPYQ